MKRSPLFHLVICLRNFSLLRPGSLMASAECSVRPCHSGRYPSHLWARAYRIKTQGIWRCIALSLNLSLMLTHFKCLSISLLLLLLLLLLLFLFFKDVLNCWKRLRMGHSTAWWVPQTRASWRRTGMCGEGRPWWTTSAARPRSSSRRESLMHCNK